jgi:hypothetical protein
MLRRKRLHTGFGKTVMDLTESRGIEEWTVLTSSANSTSSSSPTMAEKWTFRVL